MHPNSCNYYAADAEGQKIIDEYQKAKAVWHEEACALAQKFTGHRDFYQGRAFGTVYLNALFVKYGGPIPVGFRVRREQAGAERGDVLLAPAKRTPEGRAAAKAIEELNRKAPRPGIYAARFGLWDGYIIQGNRYATVSLGYTYGVPVVAVPGSISAVPKHATLIPDWAYLHLKSRGWLPEEFAHLKPSTPEPAPDPTPEALAEASSGPSHG